MWIATVVVTLLLFDGVTSMFFQTRQTRRGCIPGLTSSQAYNVVRGRANMTQFQTDLNRILVVRVPGTLTHNDVRQFIVGRMSSLGWAVEEDTFPDQTPFGPKEFTNIIATWNPSAAKRIVVACHYDSKFFQNNYYVGATDSAVPCALMIDSAAGLGSFLAESNLQTRPDVTLQFIFFDGEEAFARWTSTDSLYGSRHLANKWKSTPDPNDLTASNYLQNINVFILLDLIGTSDTHIRSPWRDRTGVSLFNTLSSIESCLRRKRWLQLPRNYIFHRWAYARRVEDDHIPFLNEGVSTLHLISSPFPSVWHTDRDNLNNLDFNVIQDFAAVFRLFLTSLLVQA